MTASTMTLPQAIAHLVSGTCFYFAFCVFVAQTFTARAIARRAEQIEAYLVLSGDDVEHQLDALKRERVPLPSGLSRFWEWQRHREEHVAFHAHHRVYMVLSNRWGAELDVRLRRLRREADAKHSAACNVCKRRGA